MRTFGTTVLFQAIDDKDVDAALDREPSLVETTNSLGVDVLQARRALDIDGVEWAMITEITRDEIEQPVADFARNLLIAIALFLVAITFIAARWSDRLLQSVRIVSTRLRAIRTGQGIDVGGSAAAIPDGAPTEFVELAGDLDTMLETLAARQGRCGRSSRRAPTTPSTNSPAAGCSTSRGRRSERGRPGRQRHGRCDRDRRPRRH